MNHWRWPWRKLQLSRDEKGNPKRIFSLDSTQFISSLCSLCQPGLLWTAIKSTKHRKIMLESNTMETSNGTQDVNGFGRMNSTSSQSPLTTTYKQHFRTKCLSLLGLSMFECCLIISNAIFILILMPMVFKISADVNDVRHDGLQEIKGTFVNNLNFIVYMLALVRFWNFFFDWSILVRFWAIINTLTILFILLVE